MTKNKIKNERLGKVGGMALLEGVMMKSKNKISMAVRKYDGTLELASETNKSLSRKIKIDKIPIVRGCYAFIESLISGIKAITDSAKMIDIKDDTGETVEITEKELRFSVIIAVLIAVSLFLAIPNIIANFIAPVKIAENKLIYNILETTIKLIIFIIYIVAISNLKEIKKLFMYHGAEHKAVNAYENTFDKKLTVDIVRNFSRFHARCGSSFLVLVLLISFIVSYFITIPNFFLRLVIKFICLPLIAGIAYEVIRYNGKHINLFTKITSFPGVLVQKITTKEPNDYQIEAAIAALYDAVDDNNYINLKEAMLEIKKIDKNDKLTQNDMLRVLELVLKENKEKLYASLEERYIKYYEYINFRTLIYKYLIYNIPLQYIVQKQSFYRLDFYVNEHVLVPRADSEILVSEALKEIKENNYTKVLDLCTGSGNLGISIAKNSDIKEMNFVDISSKALEVCKKNITKLQLSCEYKVIQSNLFEELDVNNKFDIIVSNPPYIKASDIKDLEPVVKNEPRLALDGGSNGLDYYINISKNAKEYLNNNASLVFEIGMEQAIAVSKILEENGYSDIQVIKDYALKDRVVKCHFHRI